jgi:hypothetical protein
MLSDGSQIVHRHQITKLAARHRMPTTYPYGFAVRKRVISYAVDPVDLFRRAAVIGAVSSPFAVAAPNSE